MKGIIAPNCVSEGDPNNYIIAFRGQAHTPVFHLSHTKLTLLSIHHFVQMRATLKKYFEQHLFNHQAILWISVSTIPSPGALNLKVSCT